MDIYVNIQLTEREMSKLDDGQGWYKPGDDVFLGGYAESAMFDLGVNGQNVRDNWISWTDLPESVCKRFIMARVGRPSAAAELGRKGGKVRSERKSQAARENGSKGGRPVAQIVTERFKDWLEHDTPFHGVVEVGGRWDTAEAWTTKRSMRLARDAYDTYASPDNTAADKIAEAQGIEEQA